MCYMPDKSECTFGITHLTFPLNCNKGEIKQLNIILKNVACFSMSLGWYYNSTQKAETLEIESKILNDNDSSLSVLGLQTEKVY